MSQRPSSIIDSLRLRARAFGAPPRRGPGVARFVGAAAGGLAAGAGVAHLLYTQGHRIGLDLREKVAPPEAPEAMEPHDYDAHEPGRGRLAQRPDHIPLKGWIDILWRTGAAYTGDRVGFVAGGVTFFTLLSLFPILGSFVTIYGLFADPAGAWDRLQFLNGLLPGNVASFVGEQMQRLAENSSGELTFTLIWTLALSLWSANGAVKTLFYGLNVAYHEVEKRNIVKYNLICMAFTLGGILAVLTLAGLVVGVPVVLALFGLEDEWAYLAWLRWPVLLLGYMGGLALIYRVGPCRQRARWSWLTPGAIFAAVISVTVSLLFSWYLSNFVKTDSYGPLAAVMGVLLWIWISAQVILMGAELNAEVEHQTAVDTTTGQPEPLGGRGATVADTVGARRGNPAALAFTMKHAEDIANKVTKRKHAPPSSKTAPPSS